MQILTVDIAHGDSIMMLETLSYVKKVPNIDVIAEMRPLLVVKAY